MPIVRCSAQKNKTIEEFYREFIPKPGDRFGDGGTPMLKVLEILNRIFKETDIYGLTSHTTLLLLSKDDNELEWFVAINGFENRFCIEYIIPKKDSPWENATIKGQTTSLDLFEEMIIISMYKSEGWIDNIELKKMYDKKKAI
ncbi:hypothetical protein [Chryseobacterium daecheongense]|uniref:Uncharacterized protein n=1 Tax=Chryseobacterium daecheongense TaxID=192389 RepID=A0A3N0W3L8_9FLAO|nr:hypothetical protein [Chryseobacterium daecheongense]ROH99612.1 hypothetical protein EGI05_01595 [Chryseobacterium daecheongense]TDX95477.1 hypothetical protein BCF50_1256 [Chryseobacterium daecheongense]